MNREEILAKSREEKHDEGFLEAENQGRKIEPPQIVRTA